jgi:23S rRNA pseudouridine1911/1915/1917 synthase
MDSFIHPTHLPPQRLDQVLAQALGLGLRRCRALIGDGLVLVDGRPLSKGTLVRPGQMIQISTQATIPACPEVWVVARAGNYAALSKPAGVHSVAGRGPGSLEACLPGLGLEGWHLLNRLDFLTSGLVLAAALTGDEVAYKEWQNRGQVDKWYLAQACGSVDATTLRGRIQDDRRRVVRVTADEDEPLRWTWVWPVCSVGANTVVLARIRKGRRHQIRAHLAAAGHPLVGDPVYGAEEPGGLFLHHWRVDLPGFSASLLPGWPWIDGEQVEAVRQIFPAG